MQTLLIPAPIWSERCQALHTKISESFDISVVLLSRNKNPFNWSNYNLTTSLNSNGGLLAISLLLFITATDLVCCATFSKYHCKKYFPSWCLQLESAKLIVLSDLLTWRCNALKEINLPLILSTKKAISERPPPSFNLHSYQESKEKNNTAQTYSRIPAVEYLIFSSWSDLSALHPRLLGN